MFTFLTKKKKPVLTSQSKSLKILTDRLTDEEIELDEGEDLTLIVNEFKRGFEFIKQFEKSVSFFGSSRSNEDDEHYKDATLLAATIVKELDYAVVTGGGPGVMEAANRGAAEVGGKSVGLTIKLPKEQSVNPYVNQKEDFNYFFVRKTMLTFAAEAFIFYPGGFGTLDEFFEILTLVQTKKIPPVPLILVGSDYWRPLQSFLDSVVLRGHDAVEPSDMSLFSIVDDHQSVVEIIRNAPIRNWWKNFEL